VSKQPQVISTTTLIGDKVFSRAGEELGILKELMIDLYAGQVKYAVLSINEFLGLGDQLVAVPWPALSLNAEDHTLTLHVDREELQNAPGFDKDNRPDEAEYESGWLVDLYDYYGYVPSWTNEPEWA
jgi:sporulation protein YlmC with PRC-barrel domain